MVTHMSRKRRSKRHVKRSIKRYSKHTKTRIRRNMYRKKHKKTQRGGTPTWLKDKLRRLGFMRPTQYQRQVDEASHHADEALPVPVADDTDTAAVGIVFKDTEGRIIDIGKSTTENTFKGERFLKGNITIFDRITRNPTEGGIVYYLITSVKHLPVREANHKERFQLEVRSILSRDNDVVTLSDNFNREFATIIASNDDSLIANIYMHDENSNSWVIDTFTTADLSEIKIGYINPFPKPKT